MTRRRVSTVSYKEAESSDDSEHDEAKDSEPALDSADDAASAAASSAQPVVPSDSDSDEYNESRAKRKGKAKPKPKPARAPRRARITGPSKLLELPLDVLVEILSQYDSEGLYHLALLNKGLHKLLTGDGSKRIWQQSRWVHAPCLTSRVRVRPRDTALADIESSSESDDDDASDGGLDNGAARDKRSKTVYAYTSWSVGKSRARSPV